MDLGFTEEQIERYSRHILLGEVGGSGQRRLLNSSAFVVGAGGLGSPAILYLAGAGVGRIGVADGDVVELSNLQRQVVHRSSDVGSRKTLSAERAIRELNSDCEVEVFSERLTASNIRSAVDGYDVVLDGSDNFPTRFLVSDCCWLQRIPLVSAAVLQFEGQLLTVVPEDGNPCYRCMIPTLPAPQAIRSCATAGVLGAVVGVMGTLQATEAIKTLLGIGEAMKDRLLIYDALECEFSTVARAVSPSCPLCGDGERISELVDYDVEERQCSP